MKGNVRELANVIEYAVAVAKMETILPEDLPEEIRHAFYGVHPAAELSVPATPSKLSESVLERTSDSETDRLRATLEVHHWRGADAARALGLSRSTLWRRMRELQLI